jgi:hypothetical protein
VVIIKPAATAGRALLQRRPRGAGLPDHDSPHAFLVAMVSDLLEQYVELETVQPMTAYESRAQPGSAAGAGTT